LGGAEAGATCAEGERVAAAGGVGEGADGIGEAPRRTIRPPARWPARSCRRPGAGSGSDATSADRLTAGGRGRRSGHGWLLGPQSGQRRPAVTRSRVTAGCSRVPAAVLASDHPSAPGGARAPFTDAASGTRPPRTPRGSRRRSSTWCRTSCAAVACGWRAAVALQASGLRHYLELRPPSCALAGICRRADYPDGRVSKEAVVEPATMDRIQRMIDDEATERFPAGAVPRLVLLHHGAAAPGQGVRGHHRRRGGRRPTPYRGHEDGRDLKAQF
jgi:hypothetical protein